MAMIIGDNGVEGAHPDTAAMENLVFTPVGSKRLVIKGITCLAALAGFALAAVSRCAPHQRVCVWAHVDTAAIVEFIIGRIDGFLIRER